MRNCKGSTIIRDPEKQPPRGTASASILWRNEEGKGREGKGGPAEDGGEGAEVVGLDVIDGGLLRVHDVNGGFRGTLGHGERNRGDEDQDEKNRRWR